MFAVETTLVLPHAPATVFATAGDLALAPGWRAGVADVVETPDAGARARCATLAYHALGARYALCTRLLAREASRYVAWRSRGELFTLDVALQLEADGAGTRVTYHSALAIPAPDALPPQRATALRRLLVRRAPRDLERLAALLDGVPADQVPARGPGTALALPGGR